MNKAKAMFAAGVIVVVAAASGALWYLNENGNLGNGADEVENTSAYVQEEDDYQPDNRYDDYDDEQDEDSADDETTTLPSDETPDADETTVGDVNDFLSVFSKLYFAEQSGAFDKNNYREYEVLQFAYLHIKTNDRDLVVNGTMNDSIGSYMGVAIEDVNAVTEKYFGITMEAKNVYTENDYDFFIYKDGYFYTPAADGVGFTNTCVVDSFDIYGAVWTVQFTIYDGSAKYATGEARVRETETGMKVEYYRVYL